MSKYDLLFDEKVRYAAEVLKKEYPTLPFTLEHAKQVARLVLMAARAVEEYADGANNVKQ
jgi:hypothetical protein